MRSEEGINMLKHRRLFS